MYGFLRRDLVVVLANVITLLLVISVGLVKARELSHRHVDPDRLRRRRDDDLHSEAEAGTRAADAPPIGLGMTRRVDLHPTAKEFDFQFNWFEHRLN